MNKKILCAIAVLLVGSTCHAALFSGPSSFTAGPVTQLGALTNNLTLTDNANGFVVSGQVIINVSPSPIAGTLVSWTVDRPLDATYGSASLMTTTILDGFSQPPIGAVGTTNGLVDSYFTNFPVSSLSLIPVSLPAGAATWNNLVVNSSTFSYTSGGANFLRQQFFLDGIYNGGPGGNWIVDVPVATFAFVVPEPPTAVLLGLGFAVAVLWRPVRGTRLRR